MAWTKFLLGRPGYEFAFEVPPEGMSIDYTNMEVVNENLAGDLRQSIVKVDTPVIQIKSSYLGLVQRNQIQSLRHVSDSFLGFRCRDDWQIWNEPATVIDTTHIQVANSSITRLSAALVAAGFPSIMTFVDQTFTIVAGVNDAIDVVDHTIPKTFSCFVPAGKYTSFSNLSTAIVNAIAAVSPTTGILMSFNTGLQTDSFSTVGHTCDLLFGTGPNYLTSICPVIGFPRTDLLGFAGGGTANNSYSWMHTIEFYSQLASSGVPGAISFLPGAMTYADATRILTLTNALPNTTNPLFISYQYTGWLVKMTKVTPSNKGGWLDRSQYDFQLVGA